MIINIKMNQEKEEEIGMLRGKIQEMQSQHQMVIERMLVDKNS